MGARRAWGRKPPVLGAGWRAVNGSLWVPSTAFLQNIPNTRKSRSLSGDTEPDARTVSTRQLRGWPLGNPRPETPQRSPVTDVKERGGAATPTPRGFEVSLPPLHLACEFSVCASGGTPHRRPPSERSPLPSSSTWPGARPSGHLGVCTADFAGSAWPGPRASVLKKWGVVCSPAPHSLGLPTPPPRCYESRVCACVFCKWGAGARSRRAVRSWLGFGRLVSEAASHQETATSCPRGRGLWPVVSQDNGHVPWACSAPLGDGPAPPTPPRQCH